MKMAAVTPSTREVDRYVESGEVALFVSEPPPSGNGASDAINRPVISVTGASPA